MTELAASGLCLPLSMTLPAGLSAAIHTSRELENDVIVALLLGFNLPVSGQLTVCDVDPGTVREPQLPEFRKRIGVIYRDGGLISNLNVWDNLTLQFAYFSGLKRDELKNRADEALKQVGYSGSVELLPSRLSLFERRVVALARAFLIEPDLIICQSTLDGLTREEQALLCRLLWQYHNQGFERTLLFITSYPDSLKGLALDFIYSTGGSLQL